MMSDDECREEVMMNLRLAQLPAERRRERQQWNQNHWANQNWDEWQQQSGWTPHTWSHSYGTVKDQDWY